MYLGQGPALKLLVASVATLAAACSSDEAAAPARSDKSTALVGTARAALISNTALEAVGDTYVRQFFPNENEGALPTLSVQTNGRHRTILYFDTPALVAAVGNGTVLSARIDMFIDSNGGGWGTGRAIAIHAMRQASEESSATWNCAADADASNDQQDCGGPSAWNMGGGNAALPYVPTLTSSTVIANGTRGVVSFDVTADVQSILAGSLPGDGWLIKKVDENASGSLRFMSREQGVAPRLTLTIELPNNCTPTSATDEICNGIDDDCDGAVDDDYAPVETVCGVGACAAPGVATCENGEVVNSCTPGTPAGDDTNCDGIDDDCNGSADDGYVGAPTQCGVGACQAQGAMSCIGGTVVDGCAPGQPAAADTTCDGQDDDCDGAVDEEFEPGCAGASALSCVDGTVVTTACSDGNACNGEEECAGAASCVPGTPPALDDGNPCTADVCIAASGVSHVLVPAGTSCAAYSACDASGQCVSLLPPDPTDIAPDLRSGTVSFLDRTRFLYEGEPRIQTGVAPGTILNRSAAVVRGRLLGPDQAPLPQVKVSVIGHPEYGQTFSRIDGEYDLAVNGGPLTLRFERGDVIEIHRAVAVPWQDYALLDDVALTARDSAVALVALPSTGPSMHQASLVSDARGSRTARLFVPSGTGATLRLGDGSSAPATSLSIRASELSVGASPDRALPALLPDTVSSAYAIELSADEADAAHARVELSRTIPLYVDDFTALPVGTALPFGAYDRQALKWIGQPNGRVVKLIGVNAGLAQLDIDGSGNPASSASLAALGIDDEERAALAGTYTIGAAFFRLPIRALGSLDVGLPFRSDEGTGGVDPKAPGQLAPLDDPSIAAAPAEGQVLAQSLPLAGTPFTLEYRSNRVLGSKLGRQIAIPAVGTTVSTTLLGSIVDVRVAGQRHTFSLPATASTVESFSWDGLDVSGRALHGWQRADIRVGLLSPQTYTTPDDFSHAFAHTSFVGVSLGAAPAPRVRWLRYDRMLHAFDSRQTEIGAWAINQHHEYDPKSRVVYLGDGSSYPTRTTSTIIDRFAGISQASSVGSVSGDGGPALNARMDSPRALALAPDGSLYIGTRQSVRRVDATTLTMSTVAGGNPSTCSATLDEGTATDVCIFARTVDFGRDGALYITDNPTASGTYDRLRRLDLATGRISLVAGVRPTSGCANMGDGGLARDAALCNLTAHASAPDGSIYLLDRGNAQNPLAIRKISTDGTIDTVGTANWPATDDVASLAVGPDGSVYVAQTRSVLRLLPTGEMRHFAGNLAANGDTGEGGPAVLARFGTGGPSDVSVGADGRVYIGDTGNAQIRMVDQQGIIRRLAGTVGGTAGGNGGSPLTAMLGSGVVHSVLGPDGSMFVTSRSNHTVRVVKPNLVGDFAGEAVVPSRDGSQLYRFAADGRHLETRTASTGALVYAFEYDADGRLIAVRDAAAHTTLIERDEDGNPIRIVAPLGEETLLDTDARGYVATFIAPNGDETALTYSADGLLTRRIDPSGTDHAYSYDADGRLLSP
jgi:YD repeat-containing protein